MSSETYDSYAPSPAERARIEAERRRREDEERRRQEELRRRQLLENEKDRAAWALNYQATARRYRIAGLRDRIGLLRISVSTSTVDRLLEEIECASDVGDVERQLEVLEREIAANVLTGREPVRAEAFRLLEGLRQFLVHQDAVAVVEGVTLDRWRRIVEQAWQERETNMTFHADTLRQIDRQLRALLDSAPAARTQLVAEIEQWIPKLRAALEMSESSETRSDLEQTLAQLENLADVGNVAEISVEMPQLRVAAQRSLNAARNADLAVAAQRRFVSAMVESLESIGCHVQPLVPAPSGAAALSAETADGDRLDGRVGADGKVHLRFVHLADGMDRAQEQREARRRGAEWCERRPQLVAQLEARGMTLSAEWSIEPDDEAVAVVEHSRDVDGVRRRPASQSRKANQS